MSLVEWSFGSPTMATSPAVGADDLPLRDRFHGVVRSLRMDVGLQLAHEPLDRGFPEGDHVIDAPEGGDDLDPLLEGRDHAVPLAEAHQGRIVVDADNEDVPQGLGRLQIAHVAHVEEVEAPVAEDDLLPLASLFLDNGAQCVEVTNPLSHTLMRTIS